eukprot:TRINITY_DN4174_c0_g1_i1.p1 TRINITY_DN4174_c0_g1~~TRINITY_DN4174_c0_g1_i1.p1  ORF type:complete len:281 (+),score=99.60 TRINITY_DN4174_c0_g1_i1:175-1017(+)
MILPSENSGGFGPQMMEHSAYQDPNMTFGGIYAPFVSNGTEYYDNLGVNETSEGYFDGGEYENLNEYDEIVNDALEDYDEKSNELSHSSSSAFGNVLETSSLNSLEESSASTQNNGVQEEKSEEMKENQSPSLNLEETEVEKKVEEPPKPKGPKSWADIANLKPTEAPVKTAVVTSTVSSNSTQAKKPAEVAKNGPLQGINTTVIDTNPTSARFFIIKSYSEDDVHKSIKYGIWASTDSGNKRLDKAYKESASKGPIYLFYSVNASGQFYGMSKMMSPPE